MPNITDDRWAASIDKFRDVTKWIMAGVGAVITLLLGSSPATGLGSLGLGCRLLLAVCGATVGLLGLIYIFRAAVDVLRARLTNIQQFVEAPRFARERADVDEIMRGHFPAGIADTRALVRARLALAAAADDAQAEAIRNATNTATRIASFIIADHLFERLCRVLLVLILPIVIGFGVYEWAVNPEKPEAQTPAKPVVVEATVSLKDTSGMTIENLSNANKLSTNCAVFTIKGRTRLCTKELPARSSLNDQNNRTYVALPSGLFSMLTNAIEAAASEAGKWSPLDLAKEAAEKFVASASEEIGKDAAKRLFDSGEKSGIEHADPHMVIIVVDQERQRATTDRSSIQVYPFAVDSGKLPRSLKWRGQLGRLLSHLEQGSCRFDIRGFADRRGSASHNLYLSLRRANTVAHYLESNGVPRQQIVTQARGAFGAGYETDDAQDLERNRRVEVLARCEQEP